MAITMAGTGQYNAAGGDCRLRRERFLGAAMAGASAACRSAIDLRILNCRSDNLSSDRRLALQDDGRLAFGLIHQISDKLAERY
jgi:hypothetical protein